MITGNTGKKYGLILTKPGAGRGTPAAPAPRKPPTKIEGNVFGDESDEEEVGGAGAVNRELERQRAQMRANQQLAEMQKKAAEEDPSVYDFDSHYDDIQAAKPSALKKEERVVRQPKYIQNLLNKAQERKMEQDILFERKNAKEVAKEDDEFGQKERYVTAAYKKKLEEQKRWLEQEKAREEEEARQDVTRRGDLGDLRRNLLKSSGLVGGPSAPAPESKPTALPTATAAAPSTDASPAPALAPSGKSARREDEGTRAAGGSDARPTTTAPPIPRENESGESGDEEEAARAAAAAREKPRELTKEEKAAEAKARYFARKRKAQETGLA